MWYRTVCWCAWLLPSLAGCGGNIHDQIDYGAQQVAPADLGTMVDLGLDAGGDRLAKAIEMESTTDTPEASKTERRIVYETQIGLVVQSYSQFESQLPPLVKKFDGFISRSDTDRRYQDRQSGRWTVRIPVEGYQAFLEGVTGLGFAESRSEKAEDITEQYVDVQTRIQNNQRLESRILTMLEERAGELSDILEIERELARVREMIERQQGQLRLLTDRSALTTITLNVREERAYQPTAAPTLGARLVAAWRNSLNALLRFVENLLVGLVAFVPWLLLLTLPTAMAVFVIRRLWGGS